MVAVVGSYQVAVAVTGGGVLVIIVAVDDAACVPSKVSLWVDLLNVCGFIVSTLQTPK